MKLKMVCNMVCLTVVIALPAMANLLPSGGFEVPMDPETTTFQNLQPFDSGEALTPLGGWMPTATSNFMGAAKFQALPGSNELVAATDDSTCYASVWTGNTYWAGFYLKQVSTGNLTPGETYYFTGYLALNDGAANTDSNARIRIYDSSGSVELASYYVDTVDLSDTAWTKVTLAFTTIDTGMTVKAGVRVYSADAHVMFDEFLVSAVEAPAFAPGDENISDATPITITSPTAGAAIYYTLDGTTPTTSSTLYAGPVTVEPGTTIKAIASIGDGHPSAVSTKSYHLNLSRGHLTLLDKGLQIQALAYKNNAMPIIDTYNFGLSNFTTVMTWERPLTIAFNGALPDGLKWSRFTHEYPFFIPAEMIFIDDMVSFACEDEQDITDPTNEEEARVFVERVHAEAPNVIAYTNQSGGQHSVAEMQNYLATVMPDMVMFDAYPFKGNLVGGSPKTWYEYMQKYRNLGLGGLDGTGAEPIPYAQYLQTYTGPSVNDHIISESEMWLNQYASWAFGYKFVTAFVYEDTTHDTSVTSVLFMGIDDLLPDTLFYVIAEINRQSRNLGPALVRLLSTDVRMVMGQHDAGTTNDTPAGIVAGIAGADAYLTGVSATNLGSKNNGLPGDVIIGFFEPLDESFDGSAYSDEKYFVVTNGLSDASGTPSQTRQQITLTFDMGASGIDSLKRLSRDTGEIEIVNLVSDGGGIYHVDLTLGGGAGDLFKYNTGAPFVGIEEIPVANIPGDANGDGAVDVGDLGILAANYGTTSGATWAQGDFNGDGAVDVGDLGILAANYGTGSSSANFEVDYAEVFDAAVEDTAEETSSSICGALGLPLIAGLLLIGLMLVKLED